MTANLLAKPTTTYAMIVIQCTYHFNTATVLIITIPEMDLTNHSTYAAYHTVNLEAFVHKDTF